MNIYLLCNNKDMTNKWYEQFAFTHNVEIVCDDFIHFMQNNSVECVVSPANSFGLMDGGYDAAITEYFGDELQRNVQKYIIDNYFGEQPVGTSFLLETPIKGISLIHTPTMRVPEKIRDISVIYNCMRTCLMTAIKHDVDSIVIPAFGAWTGDVSYDNVAKMMYLGYNQIFNADKSISWENAIANHFVGVDR